MRRGYIDLFDWNDDIYSYYYDFKLYKEQSLPSDVKFCYGYNHLLSDYVDITIVSLFNRDRSFSSYFKDKTHQKKYCDLSLQIDSFKKTYQSTDTNTFNLTLIDLIPKTLLLDYLKIKHEIVEQILTEEIKPSDYDILKKIVTVISQINSQSLIIQFNDNFDYGNFNKNIKRKISYNPFKVITGRMGVNPNHFPILTLDRRYRHIVKCKHDEFMELDYNATEVRVGLSLSGQEQPPIDIHDWHNQEKFNGKKSRNEIKIDFFSWLYSPARKDSFYEQFYNKERLFQYYNQEEKIVNTDFGRHIPTTDEKWLNYLLQSTASDMFFEIVYDIFQTIKKKNNIDLSFVLHDAAMFDMKRDDVLCEELIDMFKNTRYGKYPVNILYGKNFGEMK